MNLIDKDALIESLGIETDCYDCEHETIIYYCDLDPVEACTKIIEAPVITVTTESAEKAIEVLKNAAWLGAVYSFEKTEEAVKTAIRALRVTSAQPKRTDKRTETHACDSISRQDAIDIVMFECGKWTGLAKEICKQIKQLPTAQPEIHFDEWCTDCKEYDHDKHCCPRFNKVIRRTVEELKAQPKIGHWVEIGDEPFDEWECDKCGFVIDGSRCVDPEEYRDIYIFCPHCGCRMKEGDAE